MRRRLGMELPGVQRLMGLLLMLLGTVGLADFKGVRFSKNKDLASSYLDGCFGGISILG